MKRRRFIQTTALATAALSSFPNWALPQETLNADQLIGQGRPELIEKDGYRLRPAAAEAFDKMVKDIDAAQYNHESMTLDVSELINELEKNYKPKSKDELEKLYPTQ